MVNKKSGSVVKLQFSTTIFPYKPSFFGFSHHFPWFSQARHFSSTPGELRALLAQVRCVSRWPRCVSCAPVTAFLAADFGFESPEHFNGKLSIYIIIYLGKLHYFTNLNLKAIWGWFPLLTIYIYIYLFTTCSSVFSPLNAGLTGLTRPSASISTTSMLWQISPPAVPMILAPRDNSEIKKINHGWWWINHG